MDLNNLEAKTVFNFVDGNHEHSVCYNGLIDIKDGETINLIFSENQGIPVSRGNYSVRQKELHNQLSIYTDQLTSDKLYRYYKCLKLHE